MKLIEAIALSPGNKAKAMNDEGKTVVVQERYSNSNEYWYKVWHLTKPRTQERDITFLQGLSAFAVDAEEGYWSPIGE